ncbi:N-acetylmuramoyl-L-alanine amidase domain, partial [uncultured Caudovirales phage]
MRSADFPSLTIPRMARPIPAYALGGPVGTPRKSVRAAGQTYSPKEIKAILAQLSSMGKGQDTIIAQINPREAAMLKRAGGSGAINPRTGLLSFDDGGGGDDGGGDGGEGGGDPGGEPGADPGGEPGEPGGDPGAGGGGDPGGDPGEAPAAEAPASETPAAEAPADTAPEAPASTLSDIVGAPAPTADQPASVSANPGQAPASSVDFAQDMMFNPSALTAPASLTAAAPTSDQLFSFTAPDVPMTTFTNAAPGPANAFASAMSFGPNSIASTPASFTAANPTSADIFDAIANPSQFEPSQFFAPPIASAPLDMIDVPAPAPQSAAAMFGAQGLSSYSAPADGVANFGVAFTSPQSMDPALAMAYPSSVEPASLMSVGVPAALNADWQTAAVPADKSQSLMDQQLSPVEIVAMTPEEQAAIFGKSSPDSSPAIETNAAPVSTQNDLTAPAPAPAPVETPAAPVSTAQAAAAALAALQAMNSEPPASTPAVASSAPAASSEAASPSQTASASPGAPGPAGEVGATAPSATAPAGSVAGTAQAALDALVAAGLGAAGSSSASAPSGASSSSQPVMPSNPVWNQGPAQVAVAQSQPLSMPSSLPALVNETPAARSSKPDPTNVQVATAAAEKTNYSTRAYSPETLAAPVPTKDGMPQQTMADIIVAARNIITEGRGEDRAGQIAIANVAANRAMLQAKSGAAARGSMASQIVAPNQFSWISSKPNRDAVAQAERTNSPAWVEAMAIASGVASGQIGDNTKGSTFYHNDKVAPNWAKDQRMTPTASIGAHSFYSYQPWSNAKGTGRDQTGAASTSDHPVPPANIPFAPKDISNLSTFKGRDMPNPQAVVFHHTAAVVSPQAIMNGLNAQGLAVQYIVDRNGDIYQSLPEGRSGAHTGPASPTLGLGNNNTIGVEMIAADNKDVTPAQVAAAKAIYSYYQSKNPDMRAVGHGAFNVDNPGHRQSDEGKAAVDAIMAATNAPAPITAPVAPMNILPTSARNLNSYRTGEPSAPTPPANVLNPGKQSSVAPVPTSTLQSLVNSASQLFGVSQAKAEPSKFAAPSWVGMAPSRGMSSNLNPPASIPMVGGMPASVTGKGTMNRDALIAGSSIAPASMFEDEPVTPLPPAITVASHPVPPASIPNTND